MSTTQTTPTIHFNLEKGEKFALDKGIKAIHIGLGWDAGNNLDPDASLIGLVHLPGDTPRPKFFNITPDKMPSHAVGFFNTDIKEAGGPRFIAPDKSIIHSGDDRTGGKGQYDEVILVDLDLVPKAIVELAVWATIYEAHKRNQTFNSMKNSYIHVNDITGVRRVDDTQNTNTGRPLVQYKLREEFANNTAVQVGSLVRNHDAWEFQALGAGYGDPTNAVEIGQVLERYE